MRTLRTGVVFVALVAACGGDARPRRPASPAAAPARTERVDLGPFASSVERIEPQHADPSYAAIVVALRALADAVADAAPASAAPARIRALAVQLEHSRVDDPHTRFVSRAIGEALAAIDEPARPIPSARAAYARAVRAYEQLVPDEPLVPQVARARDALEAVANTLAAIAGERPPFEIAAPAASPEDREAMRGHVVRLAEHVATLAGVRGSNEARDRAVDGLRELAAAIRVAPTAMPRADVETFAARVELAATRLARAGEVSLERVDAVKAGLVAAAAALRELAGPPAGSVLGSLVDQASAAAGRIDPGSTFGFARAGIQDAFRAVTDAYVAFAR